MEFPRLLDDAVTSKVGWRRGCGNAIPIRLEPELPLHTIPWSSNRTGLTFLSDSCPSELNVTAVRKFDLATALVIDDNSDDSGSSQTNPAGHGLVGRKIE